MASVITRATWTDDDGTGTTGTIINNSRLNADIYDKIDTMFAGAGSYATFAFGGAVSTAGLLTAASLTVSGTVGGTFTYGATTAVVFGSQTYTVAGSTHGFLVNDSTNTQNLFQVLPSAGINMWNGAGGLTFTVSSAGNVVCATIAMAAVAGTARITMASNALGGTAAGPCLFSVGRNTDGSGAAGTFITTTGNGTGVFWWIDNTSRLRIHTAAPTANGSVSDTGGTLIGAPTSALDKKELLGNDLGAADALDEILRTPVHRFRYKGEAWDGEVFHGIITDYSPAFGMDPDEAHPCGRAFNAVNAFGYTVQAFKALQAQVAQLRAELDERKAA